MISFIQSNYMGFGSALWYLALALPCRTRRRLLPTERMPTTSSQEASYHTIIPGFLTKDYGLRPLRVMGGFMQPQGHLQVIMGTVDFQLNPQAALMHLAGSGLRETP